MKAPTRFATTFAHVIFGDEPIGEVAPGILAANGDQV